MSTNRWKLTRVKKEMYEPVIKRHIERITQVDLESKDRYDEAMDLSVSGLSPYTLGLLLEGLGYETDDDERRSNGWHRDFWYVYRRPGFVPIQIRGCLITFELILSGLDDEDGAYPVPSWKEGEEE